jgi:hypothetical protein
MVNQEHPVSVTVPVRNVNAEKPMAIVFAPIEDCFGMFPGEELSPDSMLREILWKRAC